MKKIRKAAAALTAVFSLSLLGGCGLVVKTDEAIAREAAEKRAVVLAEGDGIKVTMGEMQDEYDDQYQSWLAQYGKENMKTLAPQLEQQKIQIMDTQLRNQIMTKKADELNIPAQSAELDKEFADMVAESEKEAGSKEAFDKLLESSGYTRESYQAEVMKGLRLEKLLEEVTKDLVVSDDQVSAYYEEHKATDYTLQPGATIYHIFFGEADDTAAEAKAKEAKAKLSGGAAFADIAKEYGQDNSASSGGLLGTYPWDTEELGADFMAEAKKLSEGQISEPVKTSFGWHIIKVEDVLSAARVQTLDEEVKNDDGTSQPLKESIRAELLSTSKQEKIAQLLDEWERQYNVQRYPERIPMEYPVQQPQSTQPGATDSAATTPDGAATTTPDSAATTTPDSTAATPDGATTPEGAATTAN